ncbi:MAG: hypothetical protein M1817_001737 [Caeruleum heppii]|nr:MAG: hypothetical protein M1817_001737 [Caeruleum heppii]
MASELPDDQNFEGIDGASWSGLIKLRKLRTAFENEDFCEGLDQLLTTSGCLSCAIGLSTADGRIFINKGKRQDCHPPPADNVSSLQAKSTIDTAGNDQVEFPLRQQQSQIDEKPSNEPIEPVLSTALPIEAAIALHSPASSSDENLRFEDKGINVDCYTLFGLKTLTSAFTAVAINGLISNGFLDWHLPISHYLPELGTAGSTKATSPSRRLTISSTDRPITNGSSSYWDQTTIRDLVYGSRLELPPTEATTGLHDFPFLDRERLIKALRLFGSTGAYPLAHHCRLNEPSVFTFAMLCLITEDLYTISSIEDLDGPAWYEALRESLLDNVLDHGTTFITETASASRNYVNNHHLVRMTEGSIEYVESRMWNTDERCVLAPATGLYSNTYDLLNWSQWMLRQMSDQTQNIIGIFDMGRLEESTDDSRPGTGGMGGWKAIDLPFIQYDFNHQARAARHQARLEDIQLDSSRAFQVESHGAWHSHCITLCPARDVSIVVLCNTGGVGELSKTVSTYVLDHYLSFTAIGMAASVPLSLADESVEQAQRWYSSEMLAPWAKARNLQGFFWEWDSVDRKRCAEITMGFIGQYQNLQLERYVTITAHPWLMSTPEGEGSGVDENVRRAPINEGHATMQRTSAGQSSLTADQLKTLLHLSQLMIEFDSDHSHQILPLLPHHTTPSSPPQECYSFLPDDEKAFFTLGCSHLRSPKSTYVYFGRDEQGAVEALEMYVGELKVRFNKVTDDTVRDDEQVQSQNGTDEAMQWAMKDWERWCGEEDWEFVDEMEKHELRKGEGDCEGLGGNGTEATITKESGVDEDGEEGASKEDQEHITEQSVEHTTKHED